MRPSSAARLVLIAGLAAACDRATAPEPAPASQRSVQLSPHDRPWSAGDYADASRALGTACAELPRKNDPVFRRLVSADNLRAADEPNGPVRDRFAAAMAFEEPLRALMKAYIACKVFPEVYEVTTAYLELYAHLFPLTRQVLDSLAPDDASRDARLGGVRKMQAGVSGVLLGMAFMLSDPTTADASALAAIAPRTGAAIADLRPWLPADLADPVLARFRALPAGERDPRRRAVLEELVRALGP